MDDEAFRVLADARRRTVLTELCSVASLSLTALAAVVGDSASSARIVLHHKHLPMLADAGYITWDRAADIVERGPQFDEIRSLIELFATDDGEWRGVDQLADASAVGGEPQGDSGTVD